MKNQAKVIATALDLYYKGLSLRKIAEHFETMYGVKLSYSTIYYWLAKFVTIVDAVAPARALTTGELLAADETMIRLKGRHLVLWGLLDRKTKILVAEHISKRRSTEDATALLKKGNMNTAYPNDQVAELITDGLTSYAEALEQNPEIRPERLIHVQGPGLRGKVSNNMMERMVGTIKQRTKLMEHFNNETGARLFSKGFRTYYNSCRGHLALNGRTPAQAAGLSDRKLNWIDLIGQAKKNKQSCKISRL